MSSEYSIHLGDGPITGSVGSLGPELPSTTVRLVVGDMSLGTGDPSTREGFILFVKDDRLLEMSLLFHKIAQDLAALLPDVDACCRCVPGTPDDQCAEHGFEAWLQGRVDADGDAIPIEEAAEHVEPPHRWG